MAVIKPTVVTSNRKYRTATWSDAVDDDSFQPVGFGAYPEKTLQIIGTADGAATGVEGSNDGGTTWFDLTTDGVTAISGVGGFWVWENPEQVRPKTATGGATGTDLTYVLGAPAILG